MTTNEAVDILSNFSVKCMDGCSQEEIELVHKANEAIDTLVEYVEENRAKLLTIDDIKQLKEGDILWLESPQWPDSIIDIEPVRFSHVKVFGSRTVLDFDLIGSDAFNYYYLDEYSRGWRLWTKEPTDEQRSAEKWEK